MSMSRDEFIEQVLESLFDDLGWTSDRCPGTDTYDIFIDGDGNLFQIAFPE